MNYDFQMWGAIGMLIMLGVVFRLLSLFFLWFKKGRVQWLYIAYQKQIFTLYQSKYIYLLNTIWMLIRISFCLFTSLFLRHTVSLRYFVQAWAFGDDSKAEKEVEWLHEVHKDSSKEVGKGEEGWIKKDILELGILYYHVSCSLWYPYSF